MSAALLATAEPKLAPLSVPARLPRRRYGDGARLQVLSPASLRAFEKCPEAFRRRYLLGERVAANLSMTLGAVVGDTLAHYFQGKIAGRAPGAAELDDLVLELFAAKLDATVLGPEDDPKRGREQCRAGVREYLAELAPRVEPIAVERRGSFRLAEEQEWRFVGYFDVECAEVVPDLKFGERRISAVRAARDLQATAYTYIRWAEGRRAPFVFHSGLTERPEEGPRWEVVQAPRSLEQLLGFERRVARVARQIVHLDDTEPGEWPLSSDLGWWCAPREGTDGCPYWTRCPVGGGAAVAA